MFGKYMTASCFSTMNSVSSIHSKAEDFLMKTWKEKILVKEI